MLEATPPKTAATPCATFAWGPRAQALRLGYSAQSAGRGDRRRHGDLDFALVVAVVELQESVTTATGQQRKVELGNAISTLGDVSKRVEETPVKTIQDLLVGKAPGLVVLPNTVTGGAPVLRIRGLNSLSLSNAPIVIMDGVRMNSRNASAGTGGTSYRMLNALNPDEIEDIEIVKGPSAATLYGTDAANGVVVITTKKGHAETRGGRIRRGGNISDRNHYQAQFANGAMRRAPRRRHDACSRPWARRRVSRTASRRTTC
jgi:TonB-dependent SusC/RagA subfamily outer membrane receptor